MNNILFRALCALILFAWSNQTFAYSNFPGDLDAAAKALYGSGASYSYSCTACHGSSGRSIATQFGMDYVNTSSRLFPGTSYNRLTTSQVQSIIQDMGTIDSDQDGATNAAEFTAGTNPADANSTPAPQPVCQAANPSVNLSPSSQTGTPGQSLSYRLNILNRDSAECQRTTFNLSPSAASPLTASANMQSVALNPGEQIDVIISVASSTQASDGSYAFSVTATDTGNNNHSAGANATYIVQAPPPAPVCTPANPMLTAQPTSQTGDPGDTKTYVIRILNNDSADCAAVNFNLSSNSDAELTSSLSANSVTLSPGQSQSVNITVSSDANAMDASYFFTVTATDASTPTHTGSVDGAFVVMKTVVILDTEAPTAPTQLNASVKGQAVALKWTASTDNVGVVKYSILVDGTQVAETTRTRTRIKVSPGTHDIYVQAHDEAGNVSAASGSININYQPRTKN